MITINNLKKIYGSGNTRVEALRGVDITIEKGDFVSIMGPSGSGKSTLMNVLGCLDVPTSGEYKLDDVYIEKLKAGELSTIRNKKIGFVFQSFNLLSKISAMKNVELPMIYAGSSMKDRKNKAVNALERVGLGDRVDHKPNELSGGQKQRVAIARALVNDPAVILADEPTGNLDSKSTDEILALFKELNDEGVTIVMVTHEPDVAEKTKRTIVVKDGLIVEDRRNNI